MDGLTGKVIVVAGAATGLGADSAQRLAREGATVVVGDLDFAGAQRTAATIGESGGHALAAQFDISDDNAVRGLIGSTVKQFGGLDAVHVNAGHMAALSKDTNIVDIDLDIWDQTIAVNLRGHMLVARHAIPELLKRGGGALVFTSSVASFAGEPKRPAYAATKAGINALARHIASGWGKDGIRANAITPGLVLTDEIKEGADPKLLQGMLRGTRSPRLGEARDISSMVAYLLSDEGSWINGQVVNVDGGTFLR